MKQHIIRCYATHATGQTGTRVKSLIHPHFYYQDLFSTSAGYPHQDFLEETNTQRFILQFEFQPPETIMLRITYGF